jgi:hypothetical protein
MELEEQWYQFCLLNVALVSQNNIGFDIGPADLNTPSPTLGNEVLDWDFAVLTCDCCVPEKECK